MMIEYELLCLKISHSIPESLDCAHCSAGILHSWGNHREHRLQGWGQAFSNGSPQLWQLLQLTQDFTCQWISCWWWLKKWLDAWYFFISWECHHPNWRTHIFEKGRHIPSTSCYYLCVTNGTGFARKEHRWFRCGSLSAALIPGWPRWRSTPWTFGSKAPVAPVASDRSRDGPWP